MTDEQQQEQPKEQPSKQKSHKKFNILLLEDDQFLLDMYSLKFNQDGHTVRPCFSVEEALKTLRDGFQADAVLFDIVMPDKDGFDLLRSVKEEKLAPKAILIALTNQSAEEEKKKAEELGADDYIIKATTVPSEVVSMVTDTLNKK
jgi:DNA-binding response OmpR family regulator